jgi:cytochrome c-type protein NapB
MSPGAPRTRLWHVVAVAAVTVAAVGLVTGTREPKPPGGVRAPSVSASLDRVPGYGELRHVQRGPNADLHSGALARLAKTPDLYAAVALSDEARALAVAARAGRRAYDGAPPTIPHDISQASFPSCLACHEKGMEIAGRRAPKMSHQRYDACTQCHVPESAPPLPARPNAVPNSFVGVSAPGKGARAWPGAPPVIPHTTRMRTECNSCHGPGAAHGLRTSHPWRQSCTQCHAPNAELDQRPSAELQPLPTLPKPKP